MQPLNMYFNQSLNPDGTIDISNRDMGFTEAHHLVLGYDWAIQNNWRLKFEAYGQYLTNVPTIQLDSNFTFSMLNVGGEILLPTITGLENNGEGLHIGAELTLEKFFSKGFYGLLTLSVFDARYHNNDTWVNSRFSDLYVARILLGKEFRIGKRRNNSITIDTRFATTGGDFFIPFDLPQSIQTTQAVFDYGNAYTERIEPYYRWDVKFGFHFNNVKKGISHRFYIDLINVMGITNTFEKVYVHNYDNPQQSIVANVPQIGFFPDFVYKVNFGW